MVEAITKKHEELNISTLTNVYVQKKKKKRKVFDGVLVV